MKLHQCLARSKGPASIMDTIGTTQACADFVGRDLCPFSTMGGPGFVNRIQCILEVQHKSSALVDAKALLPHPTTVSRSINDRTSSLRSNITASLQEACRLPRVACTTDMWTEQYRQPPFITIPTHWIDTEWNMVSQVISTDEFDGTPKRQGPMLGPLSTPSRPVTPLQPSKSVVRFSQWIADPSQMIVAFHDDDRLVCTAHILNTVLRNAFDEKKNCHPATTQLIESVKLLFCFIKKSSFHHLLTKCLLQSRDTPMDFYLPDATICPGSLYRTPGTPLETAFCRHSKPGGNRHISTWRSCPLSQSNHWVSNVNRKVSQAGNIWYFELYSTRNELWHKAFLWEDRVDIEAKINISEMCTGVNKRINYVMFRQYSDRLISR